MTPEERRRAGRAVADRVRELGLSSARVAQEAQIDPGTMSALIHGRRWPHRDTRERICKALSWPAGEISRRALTRDGLGGYSLTELLAEVCRRVNELDTSRKEAL